MNNILTEGKKIQEFFKVFHLHQINQVLFYFFFTFLCCEGGFQNMNPKTEKDNPIKSSFKLS